MRIGLRIMGVVLCVTTTLGLSDGTRLNVKVRLSSDKNIYKVGEPITLTWIIENLDSEPFYVHPLLNMLDSGEAGFRVSILDQHNHKITRPSLAADTFGYPATKNMVHHVSQTWMLLQTQNIYGRRSRLEPPPARLGRYKLVGTYFSMITEQVSASQQAQLKSMKPRLLTGEYNSNPVWIEIVK